MALRVSRRDISPGCDYKCDSGVGGEGVRSNPPIYLFFVVGYRVAKLG
jgi:hypothetical protein